MNNQKRIFIQFLVVTSKNKIGFSGDKLLKNIVFKLNKMSEMQKVSEVFKSNLNYYQRVAHKKLS